jgi:hypothetical protein
MTAAAIGFIFVWLGLFVIGWALSERFLSRDIRAIVDQIKTKLTE